MFKQTRDKADITWKRLGQDPTHLKVGSKPTHQHIESSKILSFVHTLRFQFPFFSGFLTLMRYFVDRFIIVSTLLTENTSRTKRLRWRDERERAVKAFESNFQAIFTEEIELRTYCDQTLNRDNKVQNNRKLCQSGATKESTVQGNVETRT